MGAGEHIARKGTKGDGPKGAFVMEVAEIQSAGSLEKTFSIDQAWLSEALEGTDLSPPTAFEAPLHIQARAVMDDVLVDGSFEALLLAPCARCNEPVEVSVGGSFTQLLTRGGSAPIEELELELTPEDLERETYSGDEIVLDGLVREFILLEVPMNPRCTTGTRHRPRPRPTLHVAA